MHYLDKLKALKKERGLTNAEIATLSGVPVSTVNRIFSGETPNPQFESIVSIVVALGGSLDELVGIRGSEEASSPAQADQTIAAYAEAVKEKDARIADKERSIQSFKEVVSNLRREKTRILIFTGVVLVLVIGAFLADLLNGSFGNIRY